MRCQHCDSAYFQSLIDTLVDMILGESIMSFYFFDGGENSFIRLRTPLTCLANGYYCTGNIQLERDESRGRHCVFSFLRLKSGDPRGVELYTENNALVYRTVKGQNDTLIPVPKIELKEYTWHSLAVSHFDKQVVVRVDETTVKIECGTAISSLAQSFDFASIGASVALPSLRPQHHFLGEMSLFRFHSSTPATSQPEVDRGLVMCINPKALLHHHNPRSSTRSAPLTPSEARST